MGLLDGWEEMTRLSTCEGLLAWNAFSSLHASFPIWASRRTPYLRSVAQTIFSNGHTVLSRFPHLWLIDHFFLEIEHIRLSSLDQIFNARWKFSVTNPFDDFQRDLSRLIVQHVWATYHNRSRQRRHLMNTLYDWHTVYHNSLVMVSKMRPRDEHETRILQCIPFSILHWRISCVCTIILTGFELELYSDDERPFAYWYLSEVCGFHDKVLQQLLGYVTLGSPAHHYLVAQSTHALALESLSLACFLILCKRSRFDSNRRRTNFLVRYKWAFSPQYTQLETPDSLSPNFQGYLQQEARTLDLSYVERNQRISEALSRAKIRLLGLEAVAEHDPSLELCREDHNKYYLGGLKTACAALQASKSSELDTFRLSLSWNPDICPWFPIVTKQ